MGAARNAPCRPGEGRPDPRRVSRKAGSAVKSDFQDRCYRAPDAMPPSNAVVVRFSHERGASRADDWEVPKPNPRKRGVTLRMSWISGKGWPQCCPKALRPISWCRAARKSRIRGEAAS